MLFSIYAGVATLQTPVVAVVVATVVTVSVDVSDVNKMLPLVMVLVRAPRVVKEVLIAVPDRMVVVGVGLGLVTVASTAADLNDVTVMVVAGAVEVATTASGVMVVVNGPSPIRPM